MRKRCGGTVLPSSGESGKNLCQPGLFGDLSSMETESIRLQKFLADQGIASRRQAEKLIEEGRVTVNGAPAVLGNKVVPGKDRVAIDESPVQTRRIESVVLAIHKPRG